MSNTSNPAPAGGSGTPAAPSATPAAPSAAPAAPVLPDGIADDVEFMLITPDKLRQVKFGLVKQVKGGDILWTINFSLFERTDSTKDFPKDPMVSLAVTVDQTLNAKVAQAAKGLTPAQTAQATGPAAVAAKAAKAGQLPQSVAKKEIVKSVE
jgi:hypothetical protein